MAMKKAIRVTATLIEKFETLGDPRRPLTEWALNVAFTECVLLTALFDQQFITLFRDAVSAIHRTALPREIA